jgi:hypothetical protein
MTVNLFAANEACMRHSDQWINVFPAMQNLFLEERILYLISNLSKEAGRCLDMDVLQIVKGMATPANNESSCNLQT